MHVILTTSLFGERSGNAGDLLTVANQAEADELVQAGYARIRHRWQCRPRQEAAPQGTGGGTSAAT